jgi:hypothetical protein
VLRDAALGGATVVETKENESSRVLPGSLPKLDNELPDDDDIPVAQNVQYLQREALVRKCACENHK